MTYIVKLLGGSHHGKKLSVNGLPAQIVMIKKRKTDYSIWIDEGPSFTIEEEVYELKKVAFNQPIDYSRYSIETRIAYVKKNSKVKIETMWKFGLYRKSEIVTIPNSWSNGATTKDTANT